jgi:hypothetical protein
MVLILKAKHGDYPVYARNEAERDKAYLHLFRVMDEWGYYGNPDDLDSDQEMFYYKAKGGDIRAIINLLNIRSDQGYEYEEIEIIHPVTP